MRIKSARRIREALLGLGFLFAASGLAAQGRLTVPEGSVIIVRTSSPIQSASAQVGQTFQTTVIDPVNLDGYTVIPAGSMIRGVMTFVQPASGNRAGVIEVNFDRLTLTDGTQMSINGKLTSTDPTERRQIDSNPNTRVVLVGGRGRAGAGVVGAGSDSSPASQILVSIASILGASSARNVNMAAGTPLAVQLEQPLALRGRGSRRPADAYTIFTTTELIQDAQRALASQNYYRGSITGALDYATQRALFNYQIDKGISATGNLDWRTARSLGLNFTTGSDVGGNVGGGGTMSFDEASALRRSAESVLASARNALGITSLGGLSGRIYHAEDFEVWFALSSFADNASLYEQVVRNSGSADGSALAGQALMSAARRVDTAIQRNRVSSQVQNAWSQIRSQLSGLDVTYR